MSFPLVMYTKVDGKKNSINNKNDDEGCYEYVQEHKLKVFIP